MKLEGIHHITCITGDAPANVEFYVGVMGLRMVKKTVNQDDPTVYHLFYADDHGSPGSDLTFFEYPGSPPGRDGAGMVHRIASRVGSAESQAFWEERLAAEGVSTRRDGEALVFSDPEGLEHELVVYEGDDPPLTASAPDVPAEHALRGFDGVRVYTRDPELSRSVLAETLGFETGDGREWTVGGELRSNWYHYDEAPREPGIQGAGSVHHVAFATKMEEQDEWQHHVASAGISATPVIDRFWFRSIYFREPSGVLFELATMGPGFDIDEPAGELGQSLVLPPKFEHMRERLGGILTPLPDPRTARSQRG